MDVAEARKEWEMLQTQWNGKGPMLLDAIRQKIKTVGSMAPLVRHFWQAAYEQVHEDVIQQSMRFQLR